MCPEVTDNPSPTDTIPLVPFDPTGNPEYEPQVRLPPIVTFPLFATSNLVAKVAAPPVFSFILLSVEVRLISSVCEKLVKFGIDGKLFTINSNVA